MIVPAAVLRQLHRIHRQLADLRDRSERGPKQIRARETNLARLNEDLNKLQIDAKSARVRSDQKQLLLKSGEDKIQQLKAKLNAATSNREYQALKDQIAADEMANSVLADEILEALEKLDEDQKMIVGAKEKITAATDELSKSQQAVREQSAVLEADAKRLQTELAEAEAQLPDDLRELYHRLVKAKQADAMAEAQNEYCGGCYQQLTLNQLAELRMSVVVVCKNCGRLIYLPEDRTPGR